jgi:hypothetical protein
MTDDGRWVCSVWVKAHETAWAVDVACYDALLRAWQGGQAFHSCTGTAGKTVTFRLGEVIAIGRVRVPDDPTDDDDPPPWAS